MDKYIKILYVEDEPDIRESVSVLLRYLCDELFTANDGREGLKAFKEHKPDIVISDIRMPNMNGVDMAKAIKEIEPEQHIVFTTAHSESNYFIEAIDMQVDGYILKPVDYDLLEKKIKKIIKQLNLEKRFKYQQILSNEIAKLQDNLLAVLDYDQNIIFSNDKFLDFFNISNLDQFKQKYRKLGSLFIKKSEHFVPQKIKGKNCIEQIRDLEEDKRVVSMIDAGSNESKAFLVSVKHIDESKHTILVFTEITKIAEQKEEFKNKAFTDELTQVYNRAYFKQCLQREIAKYNRDGVPFCFVMLDIDYFKNFNDIHGHYIGDKILAEFASVISEKIRATDIFARWGGEEFVMILPETILKNAKKFIEHLRQKVQECKFKNELQVTCSFGISQFSDGDSSETVMERADRALYKAKNNGRNRVEIEPKVEAMIIEAGA